MLFAGKEVFGFTYAEDVNASSEGSDSFYVGGVPTEKTYHYTMIFNTFVFLQVFNEINSRKLGKDEYNVFKGFFNNLLFLLIIVFTIVV